MRVFRLSLKKHRATAFSGEGARVAGGRWNHPGTRMVYCSESRALAAMELFVHLDPGEVPPDLVFIPVDVPSDLIVKVSPAHLPPGRRSYPAPDATRTLGSRWVARERSAALSVPSAVVPEERNLLLNPGHPDFHRIKTGKAVRFTFDRRLWK